MRKERWLIVSKKEGKLGELLGKETKKRDKRGQDSRAIWTIQDESALGWGLSEG